MSTELLFGDYKDVLKNKTCDVLIADPPYSDIAHKDQRSTGSDESKIDYSSFGEFEINEFVDFAYKSAKSWVLIFCDFMLTRLYYDALKKNNFVCFTPVIYVKKNPAPRLAGDGPTSAVEYLMVARKKGLMNTCKNRKGTRPGFYFGKTNNGSSDQKLMGQKPLWLMEAIIRDYTLPGDTVIDPFCGHGTTAKACESLERNCITSEISKKNYDMAKRRLNRPDQGFLL